MAKLTLQEKYNQEIKPKLAQEFNIKNEFAIPKLTKIVINSGTGDLFKTKEAFAKFIEDIASISGQKPKVQKARVSIAGFNLRAGMQVGVSSTLRGPKMYAFLEKLISIVLPRLRDFRGIPIRNFDKAGNYTLGLTEHTVFPEIDMVKVDKPRGLQVTIVNSSKDLEKGKRLLELLGMPFEKDEDK